MYVETPTSRASAKIASCLRFASHAAAAIDRRAVGEVVGPDAPADAVARFEDDDRLAGLRQAPRGGEAGVSRADDTDVRIHPLSHRHSLPSADLFRQPRGMAGRSHLLEGALCLAQEARAVASVAEIHGEARAFLDHERGLGACTGLGDERLGARQARLDGRLRGRAVERAQHPRLREVCAHLPATRTALLRQPDRPLDGGARGLAVAGAELRLGETGEKVGFEVSGEGKCLCLLEGLQRGSWVLGGKMGTPERVVRRCVREGAPRALRILERLAGVSQAVRRVAGVLVGKDAEHEGPARDLPLAQLARPARRDFEIRDAERQPPHLDLHPAAARARPDLHGEAHPLHAEVRIVTADLERLVEQAQRVVEAARGDVDVSEIRRG